MVHSSLKEFGFEVYILHPVRKSSGWDIKHVAVIAPNYAEAKSSLSKWESFDCIISLDYTVPIEAELEFESGSIIELSGWRGDYVALIELKVIQD